MSINLLVLYEIADRAAKVTSKRAYKEFERWVMKVISECKDAAVEHAARIQLFRLKDQFAV